MAQIEKRDITRVSINLPTPMVKKVKEYALELGLPITQSYTVLINMGLEQKQLYNSLPELIKSAIHLKIFMIILKVLLLILKRKKNNN